MSAQSSGLCARAATTVMLVASSGGHLSQLVALRPWWREKNRLWVTFESDHAASVLGGERVVHAFSPTTRNIPNLLRNTRLAFSLLRRERPDVIVSTGAGVAVPFFLLGRALRIPTVYIEVYDRIDMPTVTGRICRPFASLFLAQWEAQKALYPGSVLVGGLL